MFRRQTRDEPPPRSDGADRYDRLRTMALRVGGGAMPPAPGTFVVGLVVDLPASTGTSTLVAFGNDTASVYSSTGGATVDAGLHAAVASATRRLLTLVDAHLAMFREAPDHALPPRGSVRLHVLTTTTDRRADAPTAAFSRREPQHELSAVLAAVQELVTEIRAVTEQR